MTTLRETIQSSRAQLEQAKAATAADFDTKIAALDAQLAQDEGAFVAVLDTDWEKVRSFFGSIAQHL
jgi:hypothetical protein